VQLHIVYELRGCHRGLVRTTWLASSHEPWRRAGVISAARLAAAVLDDGHMCAAALAALKRLCTEFAAAVRAPESWVRRASKTSDRCVSHEQRGSPLGCVYCVGNEAEDACADGMDTCTGYLEVSAIRA